MRPFGFLIGVVLAALSLDARAIDIGQVRKSLANVEFNFIWRPTTATQSTPSKDEKGLTPATISRDEKGELIFSHADDNNNLSTYRLKISSIKGVDSVLKLETKSSTCERMKPATKCGLRLRIPQVLFDLVPLNGASPAPKKLRSLDILTNSNSFIAKFLPELVPLYGVSLDCNDWSWATATRNNKVTFIELSAIGTQSVFDLGRSAPSQSTVMTNFECDVAKMSCQITGPNVTATPVDLLQFVAFNDGIAIETAEGEGSCSTEFKSDGSQEIIALFQDSERLPAAGRAYNTPAFLKTIQSRLDERFIDQYRKEQVDRIFADLSPGSTPYLPNVALMLDQPWLRLFDLVGTGGGSTNCEKGRCIYNVTIQDGFYEERN